MPQILIVEDNLRMAALMEKALGKHGFATTVAKDGEAALQQIQNDRFDLMLLDINLPVMDGWTVMGELRRQGNQLPIIIVSANSDISETIAVKKYGVNGYIQKPFRVSYLVEQVQKQLGNCQLDLAFSPIQVPR